MYFIYRLNHTRNTKRYKSITRTIVDLIDEITESYQGKHGIIEGYKSYDIVNYQNNSQVVKYFQDLEKEVQKLREFFKESYLQNEIDNVEKLINSTIYKLKYLK